MKKILSLLVIILFSIYLVIFKDKIRLIINPNSNDQRICPQIYFYDIIILTTNDQEFNEKIKILISKSSIEKFDELYSECATSSTHTPQTQLKKNNAIDIFTKNLKLMSSWGEARVQILSCADETLLYDKILPLKEYTSSTYSNTGCKTSGSSLKINL